MLTVCWRHVGDLPLLVPGSLLSEAYQSQIAVASVKQSTLGEWQGRGRVAVGERHGMCESVFKTAGEQQGNGMETEWERRGNGMGTAWYV
jgi:hypothetical protein